MNTENRKNFTVDEARLIQLCLEFADSDGELCNMWNAPDEIKESILDKLNIILKPTLEYTVCYLYEGRHEYETILARPNTLLDKLKEFFLANEISSEYEIISVTSADGSLFNGEVAS